ncbi:MAG: aconitase X catalytic domain-containing protein [Planctomycetes bacterium]|jgi:predicted aconitase|nr:aconitase X catalytic domain-containing protein [Planctomycetota bacterium]HPY75400.1 aconitase X catalytic domain-containing protein [Planctomycetota bacterium]HQB01013.1 aconitase X catalytic domain-containing protein [Planctomycetota bacterium]
MKLSADEKEILDGKCGVALQKAMEILVALGNIYNASHLVPVRSVQVAGVSYKNLGDAGLEFLREWAEQGAYIHSDVAVNLNPAGMDLEKWASLGFRESFAKKQLDVIQCFQNLGISPVCSCTPYLLGNVPRYREHIAWSESSAVAYANSMLGARTNREGGPSALAAAILGKTPYYGLHLDENRKAKYYVDVQCTLKNEADFGALGYMIGKKVAAGIPYFHGIQHAFPHEVKALGAAMAATGAVSLFHIENITPETHHQNMLHHQHETIAIHDVQEGYEKMNSNVQDIDLVSFGCPHASYQEIRKIAQCLKGKKVKSDVWITTSYPMYHYAKRDGVLQVIEDAGGKIVCDTCMVVAPIQEMGIRSLMTNSAKAAFYVPNHCNVQVRYGSLQECIQTAIQGKI